MNEFLVRLSELTDNISNLCAKGILGNSRVHLLAISAENEELKKLIRELPNKLPLPCSSHCNKCKNKKVFA